VGRGDGETRRGEIIYLLVSRERSWDDVLRITFYASGR
jgi:hypothetical protein